MRSERLLVTASPSKRFSSPMVSSAIVTMGLANGSGHRMPPFHGVRNRRWLAYLRSTLAAHAAARVRKASGGLGRFDRFVRQQHDRRRRVRDRNVIGATQFLHLPLYSRARRDPAHQLDTLCAGLLDDVERRVFIERRDVARDRIHAFLVEILVDETRPLAVELV